MISYVCLKSGSLAVPYKNFQRQNFSVVHHLSLQLPYILLVDEGLC